MTAVSTLRNQPVAVLGAGIEGRDLTRHLRGAGARVTVFDTRERAALGAGVAEIEALGAELRLGIVDPGAADAFAALFVSQSVLLHRDPFVAAMRALGRPITSMAREFLRLWPGPIAGVTGSSGKTTTTAIVAAAFAAAEKPHILGGNIGAGLLAQLPRGGPDVWAILEVSHTQLQLTDRSPTVAAVTNVTPNHLDQFGWEEYVDLKRTLVAHQSTSDAVVLNAADRVVAGFSADTPARPVWFNAEVANTDCYFASGELLVARVAGRAEPFMQRAEVPLRGGHNVENVLAAAAVTGAAGIPAAVFAGAVRTFTPVAHRLEPVGSVRGVSYVNDSIATSPERSLAGIRSFSEPLVLLLGGREKQLPLAELVLAANARARAVIVFGEAAGVLARVFSESAQPQPEASVIAVANLAEAVAEAARQARSGDVVLLSPACASFDAYANFERRGEEFRALVAQLAVEREDTPSR